MLRMPNMFTRLMIFLSVAAVLGTVYALPLPSPAAWRSVHSSGIRGTIVSTGNCPGPQRKDDTSCGSRPYQGPLAVRRSSDQEIVATVSSNREGNFRIAVPPGKYFITQGGEARYPLIHSDEIVVVKNKFTAVKLSADIGMR